MKRGRVSLPVAMVNHQVRLKMRPNGAPRTSNFETVDVPMPPAREGEVLRQTLFLSLDPYMRGRMSDAPSYAQPVPLGGVMCGHTVSRVIESSNPTFHSDDIVAGYDGWQQFAVSNGNDLRKRDAAAGTADRQGSGWRRGEGTSRAAPSGTGCAIVRRWRRGAGR